MGKLGSSGATTSSQQKRKRPARGSKSASSIEPSSSEAGVILKSKKVKSFDPKKTSFLVVENDAGCLNSVVGMLKAHHTHVHGCAGGAEALELLRRPDVRIDVALVDVAVPGEADNYELLDAIAAECRVPVVLMTWEGTTSSVLKGVAHGAVDFVMKPVTEPDQVRFLWRHALTKIVSEERQKRDLKKSKKPRIIWTPDLHQRFMDAVNHLGIDKAVPKKIKELMGVNYLQREHIASHLQKYRLFLKQSPTGAGVGAQLPFFSAPTTVAATPLSQQLDAAQQLAMGGPEDLMQAPHPPVGGGGAQSVGEVIRVTPVTMAGPATSQHQASLLQGEDHQQLYNSYLSGQRTGQATVFNLLSQNGQLGALNPVKLELPLQNGQLGALNPPKFEALGEKGAQDQDQAFNYFPR